MQQDHAAAWRPAPFTLTYRLGEIALFRRRYRGLTLDAHFFDLGTDPDEPPPPFAAFRDGAEVLVARSHPVAGTLPVVDVQPQAIRYVLARYTRFHTALDGDFEGYLQKFSAKSRSTLRRKVKRFLALPEAHVREYRWPGEIAEFLGFARQVSALTYQERLLDAGIPGDDDYRRSLEALAADDGMRGWILFAAGKPVAYLCCPSVRDVLMYGYLGYDPAYAEHSPGSVLQYLAFESLFAEKRFRAFDFTEGQGEHKRFFGTHATDCADLCYFPRGAAASGAVRLHHTLDALSANVGAALDRVGLKSRVKRLIRRAA